MDELSDQEIRDLITADMAGLNAHAKAVFLRTERRLEVLAQRAQPGTVSELRLFEAGDYDDG